MNHKEVLLKKIKANQEVVGVLGLGYVGLPLAVTFAKNNIKVIGFEKDTRKADMINRGHNYIADVNDTDLKTIISNNKLQAVTDFSKIADCDAILICVPTPLDKFKKPDMTFMEKACTEIGRYIKPATFVALESTTYPTTTENVLLPIIEKESGLQNGKDFWLAFSPERVDPGNKKYKTENTPKVIGAVNKDGLQIGCTLYQKAIHNLHTVSSPRIAEMVKILENTYRLINISLINEMALLCGKMDINIWEVIEAAETKPYGFQAFYPGPGIGGHCIPLDPFYLEHIAKNYQFDLTMLNTAGHIENLMPHRMTIKITSALNRQQKAINGAKILFMGVAYKADIGDARESPALKIIDEVLQKGGRVYYHDPYVPQVKTNNGHTFTSSTLTDELIRKMDVIVFTTIHKQFDCEAIAARAKLVVDMRNAVNQASDKVYKL
ncbi:MAG TPA: nucleotide sugar dehydrogenase [Spirochaetota bacterium]|nr:nucleotide sugar dehydrogenase [Spirochaetota bacterium]